VEASVAAVEAGRDQSPVLVGVGELPSVRFEVQNTVGDDGTALDASGLVGASKTNWSWRRRHGKDPFSVLRKKNPLPPLLSTDKSVAGVRSIPSRTLPEAPNHRRS
jgi:hypothetical protein